MDFYGQIDTFFYTLLTGIILGIIFDFYRVVRGVCRPHIWITSLTDLIYWLIATVLVFIALLMGNSGEVRLYIFMGLLLGVVLYYRLASHVVIYLVLRTLKIVRQIMRKGYWLVFKGIYSPLKYFLRLLNRPLDGLLKMMKHIKLRVMARK